MVQLSTFVLVAAFAVVAPSFAAPVVSDDDGYYTRQFSYEDELDEVSLRELEEILSRAPQPWIATAGKILNGIGTAGTVASIGSAIGGMFKKHKKRSLFDDEEDLYSRFDDEFDEVEMRELAEILSRAPQPWIATAGKILNGLGTAGTVASIGSAIGGMFKSKKNKKRDFYDGEEELYMRMFADLQEEMASLERRYDSGSLDELD